MFFKKFKKSFLLLLLSLFIIPTNVLAYSDYLIAGGENIGIEIHSKGVMIVGLYQVESKYPATEAGLKVGDIITTIGGETVSSVEEMVKKISANKKEGTIQIGYLRENAQKETSLKLYKDETGVYKTGLYVKDSITGIGTLTFIDPESNVFGALGHEIIEKSTGRILEIKDGKIFESNVTSITPSKDGVPGEKNAEFHYEKVNGTISENTTKGIFGTYTGEFDGRTKYKVAKPDEIKKGTAKILTVLEDQTIKEYTISITKIDKNTKQKTKNIVFEITDQELLQKTGGIVQGMSGSPIIQDDFIIGAVTHVVVDNPQKGYGIFITNMLEEAED
ncbi:MAG: SpoIVB peptidase [Bacilli bacterium]|nr:SpoIVB peptidase [Bacilli bacterium]